MGAGFAQVGIVLALTVIALPLCFFGLMAALDKFEQTLSASPRVVQPPAVAQTPAAQSITAQAVAAQASLAQAVDVPAKAAASAASVTPPPAAAATSTPVIASSS